MRHLLLEEGNEPFNPGSSAWNEKAPRPVNVQAGRRSLYSSPKRRKSCRWKVLQTQVSRAVQITDIGEDRQ